MATLQQIKEAARLKREGTPLDKAVSTVRETTENPPVIPPTPTANPPGTKAEAIGKVVNQVGGDAQSRIEARKLAELGMSAEEINNVRSRPNWGKKQEEPSLTRQQYATNTLQVPPNQTQTGVNGETFTVAPVNPETGLSQPTPAPAPTPTPTAPEVSTTATPTPKPTVASNVQKEVDYNTSAGRESEIQKNVSELTKTNPNLLKDRNAYNQAFGYETADPGKKAILDASFNGGQPAPVTASSLYSLIANKQEIPLEQKNSGAYRVANNRYQRVNQYVNMTPTEVNQAFTSGKLIEGSQTFEDLKLLNPKLVQDAVNLRKVNGNKTSIFTYTNNPDGTPVKTNNLEKNFAEQYEEDYPDIIAQLKSVYQTPTYDEMISKINTQEVKDIQAKASAIETEMNDLQTAMDSIDKDVETELKGSGATSSRIALEKSARKEALQKQYDAKLRDYTTQYNKANNLINQNTEIYKYTQEQNKAMQSALAGVYTKQYENKLALQQNQAEYDQKIAQQAQAMNNPVTAISTMIEEYKKLGIPFNRSTQQVISDFQTSGQDLPTYLTELQKLIQSKPEYKAIQDAKKGEGISYQTIGNKVYKKNADGSLVETNISIPTASTQDWAKLDDTTLYNQKTGELKKVSASEANTYGPSTTEVTPESIKSISSRLTGNNVQCGMVSNDWMAQKFPGAKRMGDSYESKVASVESIGVSDVPQVGGVFAMNTYNSNGHTGIVQSVDLANGTFTATDANRSGSKNGGPVTTSTYKISPNFTFSKAPAGAGTIRPSDIDYFNSATATDKKKLSSNPQYVEFNNKKSTVMSDPNADIYEVMKYSQGGKDMGEERLKSLGKFSQGLSQVAELSKKIQETETGPIIGRIRSYNPYDANAQALLAEINATIPNIARGVYGEVGVLTDADIQNYAKTLPNIKSTEDTNKLVLAMTLKTMLNGFKGQIQIDGSAGRDVSGFAGTVKQYEDRINKLLSELGKSSSTPSTNSIFESDWNDL